MKVWIFSVSILFWVVSHGSAATVEKIRLTNRTPGTFSHSPQAILNTKTGQTLVVWEQHHGGPTGHSVWGRRINGDGSPLGPPFVIVNGPNVRRPDITYNVALNQFLLVYENDVKRNNRFVVLALRLSAAGRRVGRPVPVSDPADANLPIANLSAHVIFDARTITYIVFWMRTALNSSALSKEGLYASVLNPNLSLSKARTRLHGLPRSGDNIRGPYLTDVQVHPVTGKILLSGYVLQFTPMFNWQYFVSSVNLTLQNPAIRLLNLQAAPSSGAAPGVMLALQRGQSFAVFVEGTGLKQKKLNAQGRPVGAVTTFFNPPLQMTKVEFPEVQAGASESFVVAVEVNIPAEKIWMQLYNSAGFSVGSPEELDSNMDRAATPIAFRLPTPAGAPSKYGVVYVDGRQQFPPVATDSSGLTLLRVTLP
jgi:hypothetical protein